MAIISSHDLKYRKGQLNPAGYAICGAPMPDGNPCPAATLEANGRCRMHQAWELGDVIDPELMTRYGPDLPTDVLGRVKRALADPELLDLKENIRLFDARLGELLGLLDNGYSGNYPPLGDAIASYGRLRDNPRTTPQERDQAWDAIRKAMESAERRQNIWNQIERSTANRSRLVDQQQKREAFLQQHIPVARLVALVNILSTMMRQRAIEQLGEDEGIRFMAAVQEQWGLLLQAGD